ncbi:helix-turn-helix domain-containing protein [Paenibacillus naphthalenovorans]|uniref:helix-turn-helix domain-containing protein n=1 Tax=Paenibacillus naphthalenovorans TaxID=162209 RepID=UPI0009F33D05
MRRANSSTDKPLRSRRFFIILITSFDDLIIFTSGTIVTQSFPIGNKIQRIHFIVDKRERNRYYRLHRQEVMHMKFNLQKLRYERMSRQISQEKVASALNISRSSYHKKETGRIKISVNEFGIILDTLGIPEVEIINFFTQNVPEREQTTA